MQICRQNCQNGHAELERTALVGKSSDTVEVESEDESEDASIMEGVPPECLRPNCRFPCNMLKDFNGYCCRRCHDYEPGKDARRHG